MIALKNTPITSVVLSISQKKNGTLEHCCFQICLEIQQFEGFISNYYTPGPSHLTDRQEFEASGDP